SDHHCRTSELERRGRHDALANEAYWLDRRRWDGPGMAVMANRFDITVLPCGCLYDEARGCYEQRCRACQREQWARDLRGAVAECERLARALEAWHLMPIIYELRKRVQ
ncbi:hypothetical protein, partial [Candidatus Roseilinea sp. NK_OTU-006]|uniref:hypothetical protein n=1 Tax=Candidatus Roseilinea sp. NK_OTU-006 TaxID=2704250 RepID=UPI00145F4852